MEVSGYCFEWTISKIPSNQLQKESKTYESLYCTDNQHAMKAMLQELAPFFSPTHLLAASFSAVPGSELVAEVLAAERLYLYT